ncbi:hypothetical protein BGZ83_001104 [Gryganskiella cystojenkinii]|nr:hypothetical protein BGZ83_001104 [Gryganskiella cystojenkinii]
MIEKTPFTQQALFLLDILDQISPFLSLQDLGRSTLVCRRWFEFFHKILWRSVAISESRHKPDFLVSLTRNLPFVQSLRWDYTEWWEMHHVSRISSPPAASPLAPSPPFAPASPMSSSPTIKSTTPNTMSTNDALTATTSSHTSRTLTTNPSSAPRKIDTPLFPVSPPSTRLVPTPLHTFASISSTKSTSPFSPFSPFASTSPTATTSPPPSPPTSTTAHTRLQYHPPSQISFPTTLTLHQLRLDQAWSLRDLFLEGPFELIPLLLALSVVNNNGNSNHRDCRHSVATVGSNINSDYMTDQCGSPPRLRTLRLKNTNCQRREVVPLEDLLRVSAVLEELALKTHAQLVVPEINNDNEGENDHDQLEELPPLALKKLELDVRSLTGPQLWTILKQCPNLEMFSLTDYGGIHPVQSYSKGLSSLGALPMETTAMVQVGTRYQDQIRVVAPITKSRPMTNIVSWIRSTDQESCSHLTPPSPTPAFKPRKNAAHFIPSPFSRPSTPTLPSSSSTLSPSLTFLTSVPKLTHMGIDSIRFGDICLSSLLHYCPRLTSLDIGRQLSGIASSPTTASFPFASSSSSSSLSGQIQSSTIQTFLCSSGSQALKHLRVRGIRLQVEDMVCPKTGVLQPWSSSQNLETLSIAFGTSLLNSPLSSPLASPTLLPISPPLSPSQSSSVLPLLHFQSGQQTSPALLQESLERVVYGQLAQLSKIKYLEIRPSASFLRLRVNNSNNDNDITPSGIELLAGLNKTLEEFSMALTPTSANVSPLTPIASPTLATTAINDERKHLHEWFDTNWPDVKKIQVVSSRDRYQQAPIGLGHHCGNLSSPGNGLGSGCLNQNQWKGTLSQPPPPRTSCV